MLFLCCFFFMYDDMKKIVVLSGAGVSAESGLKTFRDHDGLWENYDIMEVATPQGWKKNPRLVLDFYNKRRKQVIEAHPNLAHRLLAQLEEKYDVHIITQNIDDLHERGGSTKVLHLHGEIIKARSSIDENDIYAMEGYEIRWGEKCKKNSQLRPHVVWFGEAVPNIIPAEMITSQADILIIIGTSLGVYPAAGLIHAAPHSAVKYLIDPAGVDVPPFPHLTVIKEKASKGMTLLAKTLGLAIAN